VKRVLRTRKVFYGILIQREIFLVGMAPAHEERG
jgi:hypothetical protein